jgi:hypothetical protein
MLFDPHGMTPGLSVARQLGKGQMHFYFYYYFFFNDWKTPVGQAMGITRHLENYVDRHNCANRIYLLKL